MIPRPILIVSRSPSADSGSVRGHSGDEMLLRRVCGRWTRRFIRSRKASVGQVSGISAASSRQNRELLLVLAVILILSECSMDRGGPKL